MFFWSTYNSTCNIGLPGGWARVQLLVRKCWCVPRPLLWSLYRLWFCRFDCGLLIYSMCCLLRTRADAGPDTFADLPARKTFMMKCEAGKREVRTNREAVFFKPPFYFANQCPESTFACHCKHEREEVKDENECENEWVCICVHAYMFNYRYMHVCM